MDRLWRVALDSLGPEQWDFAREQINQLDERDFQRWLDLAERIRAKHPDLTEQEAAYVALRNWPTRAEVIEHPDGRVEIRRSWLVANPPDSDLTGPFLIADMLDEEEAA